MWLSLWGGGGVHLVQVVGFRGFRTYLNAGSGPLVVCSLLLFALSLFAWCVACKYAPISRFKGVFSAFWGCCVGLCCLGGLLGLCGFCARVELGGYKTCGVFAFVFILLCPLVQLSPVLLLGFLPCLLSISLSCFLGFVAWLLALVGLLFLFPFGYYLNSFK